LYQSGRMETRIYLIAQGSVRAFCHDGDHEITFWFGMEDDIILSYLSYIQGRPGYENMVLLEDSVLYELETAHLQQLYTEDIELANWGRKLAERELIRTEERLISRQFKTAAQRYQELCGQHPDLLKRVQLGHIASYLGITQVTLSRIRAGQR
jgi:CRP-like cAMP-binding protein